MKELWKKTVDISKAQMLMKLFHNESNCNHTSFTFSMYHHLVVWKCLQLLTTTLTNQILTVLFPLTEQMNWFISATVFQYFFLSQTTPGMERALTAMDFVFSSSLLKARVTISIAISLSSSESKAVSKNIRK